MVPYCQKRPVDSLHILTPAANLNSRVQTSTDPGTHIMKGWDLHPTNPRLIPAHIRGDLFDQMAFSHPLPAPAPLV